MISYDTVYIISVYSLLGLRFTVGLDTVLSKLVAMGIEPAELLKEAAQKRWTMNSKDFNARRLVACCLLLYIP